MEPNMAAAHAKRLKKRFAAVRAAALNLDPINGLTHCFYRYPARFSPVFARACIKAFSRPGDIVLDPYMGGGTAVLEAMVLGRVPIGCDISSLAVFVTGVKVAELTQGERQAIARWATRVVPAIRCSKAVASRHRSKETPCNLSLPDARWLRKTISLCMASIDRFMTTAQSKRFAKCVLLNVGQWALNGRRRIPSAAEFRRRVAETAVDMLAGTAQLEETLDAASTDIYAPLLCETDAELLDQDQRIVTEGPADLVVTSPPYPGIHMLYHRWQVDGRRETNAPFWITGTGDGSGQAFYNFADRRRYAEDRYFAKAERSFAAVRRVMRQGAVLAQMIAFSEPSRQLRRYLTMMERAGFAEQRRKYDCRTWRDVPGRRWHANSKGELASSREVVLIHRAV